MSLAIGSRLGPYEVLSSLGAGGMGEVYRARDSQLGRDVAIKVLPEAFAHDAERLARFEREARTLASLNHPNIAIIHGLDKSTASHALVMELIEGPTLADRIVQGPLQLDEALLIAKQIAEALEAAHEQGIVHRDLKPANIKVRADGTVKVLDFGLAKALEPAGGVASHVTLSPTITSPAMTRLGVILGTAAYMSPEQAKGRAADQRTDIWSFGCVLYEMLTGRRPFGGEDVSDTMAAVLRAEPDWSALPADTPPSIRRLLERCLEKDRTRRLQHAADAVIRISEAASDPDPRLASTPLARSPRLWQIVAVSSAVLAILLAVPAVSHLREARVPEPPEIRTAINVPATTDPVAFALSPDGQQLVFAASEQGVQRLWLRQLSNTTDPQPLPGTEGGTSPFWKPDGRSIGFYAGGRLKVLDLRAGQPRPLAPSAAGRGGTWNDHDVILFNASANSEIVRVSATGGTVTPVTKLSGALGHRYPQFLPDGRHFLFFALGTPDIQGIYLASLDSPEVVRLTASSSAGTYLSPGWILWLRDGSFVAQRLNIDQRALTGEFLQIAGPVATDPNGGAPISTSTTGLIAYRFGTLGRRQLRWFSRSGKELGAMGEPDDSSNSPRLSPDSRQVALHRTVDGNTDIWLLDDGGHKTKLTTDPAFDRFAIWSPKTNRIAFDSNRTGRRNVYVRPVDRSGSEELFVELKNDNAVALDWAPDERFLVYVLIKPGDYDLWAAPHDRTRPPVELLHSRFTEKGAKFSPNGQLLAYMSDESGPMEVYVARFTEPAAGDKGAGWLRQQTVVSTAGGIYPAWSPKGDELYYLAPDGTMMAVPISATSTSIERGAPVPLFPTQIVGGGIDGQQNRQYDVSRDGRFLINTLLNDVTPITLLQNWRPH